jgi:hypothetical protein
MKTEGQPEIRVTYLAKKFDIYNLLKLSTQHARLAITSCVRLSHQDRTLFSRLGFFRICKPAICRQSASRFQNFASLLACSLPLLFYLLPPICLANFARKVRPSIRPAESSLRSGSHLRSSKIKAPPTELSFRWTWRESDLSRNRALAICATPLTLLSLSPTSLHLDSDKGFLFLSYQEDIIGRIKCFD